MTKVEFRLAGRGGIGVAIIVDGRLMKTKFGVVVRRRVGVPIVGARDATDRSKV